MESAGPVRHREPSRCWRGSVSAVLDWSLLSGPVPLVLRLGALAGGVWLVVSMLFSGRRGRATVHMVVCLMVAAVATTALDHLVRSVWMLFPDRLEPMIYVWAGVAVLAVCLA